MGIYDIEKYRNYADEKLKEMSYVDRRGMLRDANYVDRRGKLRDARKLRVGLGMGFGFLLGLSCFFLLVAASSGLETKTPSWPVAVQLLSLPIALAIMGIVFFAPAYLIFSLNEQLTLDNENKMRVIVRQELELWGNYKEKRK